MQRETRTLPADSGSTHVYLWTPDPGQPVRAVVQIVHGLAEHAGRYEELAKALTAAGMAAVAHDHRGHGKSAADAEGLGFFAEREGWATVIGDARRARAFARERLPEPPLVLLAHSMGTVVALHDLVSIPDKPVAVVLSGATGKVGPLLRLGQGLVQVEMRRLGARGRSKLLNATAFGTYNRAFRPNRTAFDWLSRDEAEVDLYVKDALCGFLPTCQLWRDLLGAQAELQTPAFVRRLPRLPYLLVSGSRDPVGGHGKQVRALTQLMERAGLPVELRLYPEARHELFHETNRADVIRETVQWISAHLPGGKGERDAARP